MGSWQTQVVNLGTIITFLLITVPQSSNAQTEVGFEFVQLYSSIAHNVDGFKSFLVADITQRFNFSQTEILSKQVTEGSGGRIRVNFTLNIDTANRAKIKSRNVFEQSLRTENYVMVFNMTAYMVYPSTVWLVPSVVDIWHQYIPEIVIAILCGLTALAIFIVSVQLLCMNKKRKVRDSDVPLNDLPASGSVSPYRVNGGFFMDEQRSFTSNASLASTRYGQDRADSLYNKLIHGNYAVPAKHIYNFL